MRDAKSLSVQAIKDEHRSISAVLHGLRYLATQMVTSPVQPNFEVFRSMIRYIDEFPERLHHPKEEQYLFAPVAARSAEAADLIADLRKEHLKGAELIRELETSLGYFEKNCPAGAATFRSAVDAYADFHWGHMRKEEDQLLPTAERVLTEQDWAALASALKANEDPIAGIPQKEYEKLFSRIALLAPAPIGFGDRWKAAG